MSGQPYKNQLDMLTARNSYLANLKLRAELDDKNLQANKIYVKTGQLPQETIDQRTVSEKLADVERLKIDLRSKLLAITDGNEAGKIVNGLTPDQLVFLAQQFEPIKEQMKKSYSLGVLAPIFIEYLTKFIDKFELTKGVEMGLQQTSANQMIANQRLILANMASKNDINDLEDIINDLGIQNSNLGKSIYVKLKQLEDIIDYIPETISEIVNTDNSILKSQMQTALNDILAELPSRQDLLNIIGQLNRETTLRDRNALAETLLRLNGILVTGGDIQEQLTILTNFVNQAKAGGPIDIEEAQNIPQAQVTSSQAVAEQKALPDPPTDVGKAIKNIYKSIDTVDGVPTSLSSIDRLITYYKDNYKYVESLTNGKSAAQYSKDIVGKNPSQIANSADARKLVRSLNELLRNRMYEGTIDDPTLISRIGKGMKGNGIVKRVRPSQVLSTDVDYSSGISESPKFIPIGRYLINKRQLDKDIIAIKRKGGSVINTLPSQRVSRKLGSVIRKVVGGSIPSYEDFSELSNEEQIFLNKVAKETRIDDKLSIPAPKKNEEEKDINQFEILKGQILAGNDNPDVVKKFKSIILKLSTNNLIPKGQVRELLLDLATLGH